MALQQLCLDKISEHLHVYSLAHSTTDDGDLQRSLRFLQEVYTSDLLSRFDASRHVPEDCADFLLNKYLKTIETDWLCKISWDKTVDTFARLGPSLEEVIFEAGEQLGVRGVVGRARWEEVIPHLPNVKALTEHYYSTDVFLKCIAKYCPKLEVLDVTHSASVTDKGLRYLYERRKGRKRNGEGECLAEEERVPCPLLKEIYLEDTRVSDECIQQLLKKLPSLQIIDICTLPTVLYKMHKDDLGSLDKAERYNLTELQLTDCHCELDSELDLRCSYDDLLKICVTLCPNLKSLNVDVSKVEDLNLCSMLNNLENLTLRCRINSSVDVSDFIKGKGGNLKSLTLDGCTVPLSVLGQYCVRLNCLEVSFNCNIQFNEKDCTPIFYNLKEFTVREGSLSNYKAICHILRSSPVLEKLFLELYEDEMISEMTAAVMKCCEQNTLKSIGLHCPPFEAKNLKDIILTCSKLEILSLLGTDLSQRDRDDLKATAKCVLNGRKLYIR